MIKREFYTERSDGVKLYRSYSDQNKIIRQDQTGNEYSEAIDVENAPYTYTETDIPAESDIEQQPETDLTVRDTLEMLNDLGVETDDN